MSNIDEQMVVAHFIVSDDVERSRRFYTEVLGGKTVISGEAGDEVTYVALANTWIIINVGGGPTDDKPTVTLETPPDPDRVSSFLNIRVADIQAVYAEWSARGAEFLTPPEAARDRDPLLHPRSRRLHHRGRPDDAGERLASAVVIARGSRRGSSAVAVIRFTSASVAGRDWPETQAASSRLHTVSSDASGVNVRRMIVTVPGSCRLSCSS